MPVYITRCRTGFVIPSESFCAKSDAVASYKTLAVGLQVYLRSSPDYAGGTIRATCITKEGN